VAPKTDFRVPRRGSRDATEAPWPAGRAVRRSRSSWPPRPFPRQRLHAVSPVSMSASYSVTSTSGTSSSGTSSPWRRAPNAAGVVRVGVWLVIKFQPRWQWSRLNAFSSPERDSRLPHHRRTTAQISVAEGRERTRPDPLPTVMPSGCINANWGRKLPLAGNDAIAVLNESAIS
jgi:hypothetical protein